MATGIEAAVIAGSASLTVGLIAAAAGAWQGSQTRKLQRELAGNQQAFDTTLAELKAGLERQAKAEERELGEQEALARFRVPLQSAAEDLGHRIGNLRAGGFLAYVVTENQRRQIAVLGTVYRFARFFATLERLYDRAEFLSLERQSRGNERDESVIQTLAEIGRVFASDRYDLADDRGVPASRFMLWREEQRAMGELARDRDHDTVVGFATFAEKATGSGARWFANFVADLEAGGVAESQRLELVQSLLAKLVRSLDEAGSYLVDGNAPQWMQQAAPDPAAITAPRKQRR